MWFPTQGLNASTYISKIYIYHAQDAEEDYLKNGDDSELHVIIFDEIDAICKVGHATCASLHKGHPLLAEVAKRFLFRHAVQTANFFIR